ncbi:hypothetical protein DAPPUDRAFT_111235 [Daphnia pulex]|uniref:PDZ domain-containing protein n=1 Tax=Daphnia pulex TaxID=6669 RepID=E9H8K0_DAPPU|nr:hypothetical protein DAPPUDRAFT_111235 [Daphnia pulex]|eukprot:EFX71931.1 hypothetical protein DAPPUDRAFT_111235 [Daphnia pulex]
MAFLAFCCNYKLYLSSSGSTGRRNKGPNHLCETLLGFVPGVTQSVDWHGEVSLRQRVIVDKLTPGGPLHQGFAHVQQGDWLEKLNGQNVTHRDLNDILSSINSREIPNVDDLDAAGSFGWHSPTSVKSCHETLRPFR